MRRHFVLCALAIMTVAVLPQELNAADALCPLGNETKHGTYLVSGAGTILGVGPASALGEVTYDGHGNSTATLTVSVNGTIHTDVTITGTYTINPDCTGSHSESDGAHYSFVVAPDGAGATWIETDAGSVVSGTELRLNHVDGLTASNAFCPRGNAGVRGTYVSVGGGTVVGVGPVSAVGTITSDGRGNMVNPFTASFNGTIFIGVTQRGTYTVNSDCTGSVTQAGAHYNFVVTPDGDTFSSIETDPGTVFSGTAHRLRIDED